MHAAVEGLDTRTVHNTVATSALPGVLCAGDLRPDSEPPHWTLGGRWTDHQGGSDGEGCVCVHT